RLAETLYPAPDAIARVARFAPAVLELSTSDPDAARITAEAAAELATTVVAAAGPRDSPVSWTGRLLRHEGLRGLLADELARRRPGLRLRSPAGDGLTGAALLAAASDLGLYAGLLRTAGR
ncbi:MAG: ATPase, partial [Hamadaea sp.]|nr:ATPase [Hamadaea sp.]